ncbi:hypothetical protein JL951_004101 [Salmonella enterica]|uniref:hypothetical protein n=1 Tax=Salmonella enterica TaxID=28901 RepID=UPI0015916E96|nr:hypothetical protein [Salmonella enterica]EDU0714759.1 hypothetical protein [Salmonella enterica]EFO8357730.1 hypothetical protein [Salmonella enterica]EGP1634385.1 hypothetical protein [Salmonella enterica]EHA5584900.1 hypothetical protein [Salmonella enterica]EHA6077968.1 hypothetical protein [Salmonella enterica]
MTTMNINRKQSQGNHWQDTLQDYKDQMKKQQQTQHKRHYKPLNSYQAHATRFKG